jgi:hypothetical protein
MPRPQKYRYHQLEAYSLYQGMKARGEDVSALDIQVELEELHPEGTASYRLIADWVRTFKQQDERQALLDSPFQWSRMELCGLPWETSSFIMEMLADVYQGNEWEAISRGKVPTGHFFSAIPTFREVIWWWRVHQSCPEIATQVGDLFDIRVLGSSFVIREVANEVIALPLETADLEACLALKPWLNEERHSNYHRKVDLGVVPPLNLELSDRTHPVRKKLLDEVSGQRPPELATWLLLHGPFRGEHPELLSSQRFEMCN